MYNITNIKPLTDFPFWFIRVGITDYFDIYAQKFKEDGSIQAVKVERTKRALQNMPIKGDVWKK